MSQVLRDARRFEEAQESYISKESRPAFHLSARVGWMNDPNGFSWYDGQYHMFYQYHPYDSIWGPMHWGHAVSPDLLHWTYLPAAMAPDQPYDRDGCYSGSAITMPDGRQMLMYTGVSCETGPEGQKLEVQTQNLAFGDGVDYEKYENNPVLTERDLPAGGSRYAFRDPKIWALPDGTWRAIMANNNEDGGGQMLLYRSPDAIDWKLETVLVRNMDRLGRMWECPDFFELDGKQVLLASAQDMLPYHLEYHNGNGTFYMLGTWDEESKTFTEECNHSVDYGIDFYAPQTVLTPDGRRVMIGWMQNWDTCNLHTDSVPWFGQMSLPRELHVRDGVLYQTPIRELDERRTGKVVHRDVRVEDRWVVLPGVSGRRVDLEVEVVPADPEKVYEKIAIRFAQDDCHQTFMSFRPKEGQLKVDRKFSGSRRAIQHQRRANVRHDNGTVKFRLILDRFSAEIFVNDGEKVLSTTFYTTQSADGISFEVEGAAILNVTKYSLEEV